MQTFPPWTPSQLWVVFFNGTEIERNAQHKDLGILFDDKLKFHDHTSTVAGKINYILGLISKSFEFLEPEIVSKLYKALHGTAYSRVQ